MKHTLLQPIITVALKMSCDNDGLTREFISSMLSGGENSGLEFLAKSPYECSLRFNI